MFCRWPNNIFIIIYIKIIYVNYDISITNIVLNHETMEWHCEICLTTYAEDTLDIKYNHTFAVYSEHEALLAAVDLAKERLDSILLEK